MSSYFVLGYIVFSLAVFVLYVVAVGVTAVVLIFFVSPKHGHSNPLVYVTVVGTVGSLSVLGCKGLGVAIKETLGGHNQLGNWSTWIILLSVAFNITVQMNYLNKALDTYNTAIVTPILYVIFTSFVILSSSILFKEWQLLGALDIIGNICGFLTIVVGVFLLQAFKDMPIGWGNLPQVLKETTVDMEGMQLLTTGQKQDKSPPISIAEHGRVSQQQQQQQQQMSHARTLSLTDPASSSSSPGRTRHQQHHARSLSYNKLMSNLQVSHSRSPSFTSTEPEGPITGYVKTDRKPPHQQHKRTSSSGSGGKLFDHKRTVSSGSGKLTGHVRTSSKTYYH